MPLSCVAPLVGFPLPLRAAPQTPHRVRVAVNSVRMPAREYGSRRARSRRCVCAPRVRFPLYPVSHCHSLAARHRSAEEGLMDVSLNDPRQDLQSWIHQKLTRPAFFFLLFLGGFPDKKARCACPFVVVFSPFLFFFLFGRKKKKKSVRIRVRRVDKRDSTPRSARHA